MQRSTQHKPREGFTLVELIIVIATLGILAVYAAISFVSPADATLRSQAEQLARDIRHLQMLAATKGQHLQFGLVAGGGGYSVTCVGGPNGCAGFVDFNVTLTGAVLGGTPSTLVFDSMGRPGSGGTYSLNTGAPPSITIAVSPVTGFVTVTP